MGWGVACGSLATPGPDNNDWTTKDSRTRRATIFTPHNPTNTTQLCCEDVQGYNVLTNFHGMDLTRDKLCSLIKKWGTLIEANETVRTTDGNYMRTHSSSCRTELPRKCSNYPPGLYPSWW